MRVLKQSTAYELMAFLVQTDHVTGATGLTLTVTASKAGGAFASITPSVTERGNGWYDLSLTAAHTDTLGDLAVHATAAGADPLDVPCQVRANVLGDTLPADVQKWQTKAVPAANHDGVPGVDVLYVAGSAVTGTGAVPIDLTQAIGSTQADGTVGAALLGLEAQALGKWVLDVNAKTLTEYRRDGTTVVRVFTLDSATAPTSRT